MFSKIKFYCLMALLWTAESFAGQLSAGVEPQQVQYGETVRLEVSYEGQDAGMIEPDFGVLTDDFAVYSTSTSMQSSFINGVGQQKRIWVLTLMPQKEGKSVIPPIKAGNYQTTPLNIEVLPAGKITPAKSTTQKTQPEATTDFWMELSADNLQPYVQQEMNVTLVIYDGKNIQFTEDPYFENAEDWEIQQMGEPIVTAKYGQRIIKIKYALFPQKTGNMNLPTVSLKGYYIERSATDTARSVNGFLRFFDINFDVTDLMGQQKPVMLKTKPVAVEVKPIPGAYGNDWWLPASSVSLQARWSDERPVFKVGEAVTREITLSAAGLSKEQLPVLDIADNDNWKQYPENPILSSDISNSEVHSKSVTRIVYIPQRGGEQIIPEIRVKWYNVKTNHIEKAVIPAEKMYVGGVMPEERVQPVAAGTENAAPERLPANITADNSENNKEQNRNMWLLLALIIGAFGGGAVCNYLLLRRRILNSEEQASGDALKHIAKSLQHEDYRGLRDGLLRWGEKNFGDTAINNLNDLCEQIKIEEFTEQMRLLNHNLYAGGRETLNAALIIKCIKNAQKAKSHTRKPPLPDLYK